MSYALPFESSSVFIVIMCYLLAELYKAFICKTKNSMGRRLLPVFCSLAGGLIASIIYFIDPFYLTGDARYLSTLTVGLLSGLASTGVHQIISQLSGWNNNTIDDTNPFTKG